MRNESRLKSVVLLLSQKSPEKPESHLEKILMLKNGCIAEFVLPACI
jgi:hypothetical protein